MCSSIHSFFTFFLMIPVNAQIENLQTFPPAGVNKAINTSGLILQDLSSGNNRTTISYAYRVIQNTSASNLYLRVGSDFPNAGAVVEGQYHQVLTQGQTFNHTSLEPVYGRGDAAWSATTIEQIRLGN